MCSIRRRHWNCSQQRYAPYPEHSGSLQVHSPSRIETDNWKMSFWSQKSWVPRKNRFHEGISPQARKIKISLINLDSPNQKSHYSAIWVSWTITEIIFPEWLKNSFRSTNCLKRKCQSILRQYWTDIWFGQWGSQWCLWTSTETTHSSKAARLNDRRQLQKCRIRPNDWR